MALTLGHGRCKLSGPAHHTRLKGSGALREHGSRVAPVSVPEIGSSAPHESASLATRTGSVTEISAARVAMLLMPPTERTHCGNR